MLQKFLVSLSLATLTLQEVAAEPFYVYKDGEIPANFTPANMGDIGDIQINEHSTPRGRQGSAALTITYTPQGREPNECNFPPPCRWSGVRWLYPPKNWGTMPAGQDLRAYSKVTFIAKSDRKVNVEFMVGGIPGKFPDSITLPITIKVTLTPRGSLPKGWTAYSMDMRDMTGSQVDISHVIGGFGIAVNWDDNPSGRKVNIYLDEVRFER